MSTLEYNVHDNFTKSITGLDICVKAILDPYQLKLVLNKSTLPESIDQMSCCCWAIRDYTTADYIKRFGCHHSLVMGLVTWFSELALASLQFPVRLCVQV